MGVVHNPESEYMKEVAKWNTPKRLGGEGPNGHEEFPKMMFRAQRWPDSGKVMCGHPGAAVGDPDAMSFSNSCQRTVRNGEEYAQATRAGWFDGPEEALAGFELEQRDIARATAEAKHGARRMSERAEAEFDKAQHESEDHVPDLPAPALSPADKKRAKAAADKARRAAKKLESK